MHTHIDTVARSFRPARCVDFQTDKFRAVTYWSTDCKNTLVVGLVLKGKGELLRQQLRFLIQSRQLRFQKLAASCGISRVTVHRFLTGETEMRSGDFVNLLKSVDIDVERLVEERLSGRLRNVEPLSGEVGAFAAEVLALLDRRVQRSVLQNLLWWIKNGEQEVPAALALRGEQLLRNLNGSKKTAG